MATAFKPTDSELQVLKILWENGPCTVRTVNDLVNENKKTTYTTTLKTMQIMTGKGMLERNEEGRSHIYIPKVKEKETQNYFLDKLLNNVFNGSATNLILQALGNHKASKDELDEIKKRINEMEGGKQ